jgi:hypothetical protein
MSPLMNGNQGYIQRQKNPENPVDPVKKIKYMANEY